MKNILHHVSFFGAGRVKWRAKKKDTHTHPDATNIFSLRLHSYTQLDLPFFSSQSLPITAIVWSCVRVVMAQMLPLLFPSSQPSMTAEVPATCGSSAFTSTRNLPSDRKRKPVDHRYCTITGLTSIPSIPPQVRAESSIPFTRDRSASIVRFCNVRRVASGAQGAIFWAFDRLYELPVALKLFPVQPWMSAALRAKEYSSRSTNLATMSRLFTATERNTLAKYSSATYIPHAFLAECSALRTLEGATNILRLREVCRGLDSCTQSISPHYPQYDSDSVSERVVDLHLVKKPKFTTARSFSSGALDFASKADTISEDVREVSLPSPVACNMPGVTSSAWEWYQSFLVLDFVPHNLHDVLYNVKWTVDIRFSAALRVQSMACCKMWFRQLLIALSSVHFHGMTHRDVKPSNMLLDDRRENLYLCDFAMTRGISHVGTEQAVTLWYRAPEILIGDSCYSAAVDMWAAGCTLVEMMQDIPLFHCTEQEDHATLAALHCSVLNGLPDDDTMRNAYKVLTNNSAKLPNIISSNPAHLALPQRTSELLGPEGIDLVARLLCWYPAQRISALDALDHPYFSSV